MTSSYKISIDEISLAVVSPKLYSLKTKISWEIFLNYIFLNESDEKLAKSLRIFREKLAFLDK